MIDSERRNEEMKQLFEINHYVSSHHDNSWKRKLQKITGISIPFLPIRTKR